MSKAKAKIRRGAPDLLRKGGVHRKSKSGERRQAKNKLRKEIAEYKKGAEKRRFFSLPLFFWFAGTECGSG